MAMSEPGVIRLPARLVSELSAEAAQAGATLRDHVVHILEDHLAAANAPALPGPVRLSEQPLVIVDAPGARPRGDWLSLAKDALTGRSASAGTPEQRG